jgi:hypothetical protein
MVSALLWGESTLRGRIGRGIAIGLELDAIPLHVSMEARLILRMALSGEDKKRRGPGSFTPVHGFSTELLIKAGWPPEAYMHI